MNEEEFEEFILERCKIDDGWVEWGQNDVLKCLVLEVKKRDAFSSGEILGEYSYGIKITRLDRPQRQE